MIQRQKFSDALAMRRVVKLRQKVGMHYPKFSDASSENSDAPSENQRCILRRSSMHSLSRSSFMQRRSLEQGNMAAPHLDTKQIVLLISQSLFSTYRTLKKH